MGQSTEYINALLMGGTNIPDHTAANHAIFLYPLDYSL
jgi:hypothetical protein